MQACMPECPGIYPVILVSSKTAIPLGPME